MATEINFSSMSFDELFNFVDNKLNQKSTDKALFESADFIETAYKHLVTAIAVNQTTIQDAKLLINAMRVCMANVKSHTLSKDMLKQAGIGLTKNSKAAYGYIIFYDKNVTPEQRIASVDGYKQISSEVALGDLRNAKKAEKEQKNLEALCPSNVIKNLNKNLFESLLKARQEHKLPHEAVIEILNAIKARLTEVEQSSLNF